MSAMTIAVAVRPETLPADARLEVDVLKLDSLMLPQPEFGHYRSQPAKVQQAFGFADRQKLRFGSIATG
jgi:hypothetical protein